MFTNIAGILLSAKASAVSGVLILAGGAIVSASSGAGGLLANERPQPTPIVEVIGDIEDPVEVVDEEADEPAEEPAEEVEELPITEQDCKNEETARGGAQARIDAAFKKYDRGLDELRAKLDGKGSAAVYEAIESAKSLLAEIRTSALEAFADATLCNVQVASVGQVGFRGGAAAVMEIAEHAVAAMETVYNLARSTVLKEIERLKPTPTPKPKATPKPKRTESPKPSKTPGCDDAMYAAKKRLQKAFDQYHGGHDKLMKELKGWASESSLAPFWETDSLLHKTYDRTRERIVDQRCAVGEDSPMALAEHAEIVLREAYNASKTIYLQLAEDKPDYAGCEDHMYAAKEVMYEAFEKWHGANDKLINGLKGWAGEGAIDAAKAADSLMHETFDTTKHRIIEAACSDEHETYVMGLARAAGRAFQAAHQNALIAVAEELKKSGDDK